MKQRMVWEESKENERTSEKVKNQEAELNQKDKDSNKLKMNFWCCLSEIESFFGGYFPAVPGSYLA